MELHLNGNASAVNGRGVRHLSRGKALRLAADIAAGRPYKPSLRDLAGIFRVSVATLGKEVKARAAAREAPVKAPAETPAETIEAAIADVAADVSLVRAWHSATTNQREWFVRTVGVDAVWDVIAGLIR